MTRHAASRAPGLALLAALMLAASSFGCSAIVGGDPPAGFACQLGFGDDPCRTLVPPMRCVLAEGAMVGTCESCGVESCGNGQDDDCDGRIDEGNPEACNGLDDDCNGIVDDALDDDGDGFTWCRTGPGELDCDDSNSAVSPTAPGMPAQREICDNLDNDCDPTTADGQDECDMESEACSPIDGGCVPVYCDTRGDLCSADQFCDQTNSPPSCEPLDDTCFNIPCDAGLQCNPRTGRCATPQQAGATCDFDAECQSSLCIPRSSIRGLAVIRGNEGVCGRMCCQDTDCGTGSTCFASGSGARACVPDSILSSGMFGAPTPTNCAGRTQCGDEDCVLALDDAFTVRDRASMVCSAPYVARRPCNSFFDCDFGEDCFDGFCGSFCNALTECPSGLCIGGGTSFRCADTCGSTEDCPRGDSSILSPFSNDNPACLFIEARVDSSGRDDVVAFCSYSNSSEAAQGTPCEADSGCRDQACVTGTGATSGDGRTCADTCCSDDDCGGNQCRPVFIHGHWEPHCLPRPVFPALGTPPTPPT